MNDTSTEQSSPSEYKLDKLRDKDMVVSHVSQGLRILLELNKTELLFTLCLI